MQPLSIHIEKWLGELRSAGRSPHTLTAYANDMGHITRRLVEAHGLADTDLTVEHLTRDELVLVFGGMLTTYSPASVRRARATLNTFLKNLRARGLFQGNPIEDLALPQLPSRQPRIIMAEDYPRLLLQAALSPPSGHRVFWPERDVALVATYLGLGVRLSEAINICPDDIEMVSSKVYVQIHGKRNKQRRLPVAPPLYTRWATYLRARAERFPALQSSDQMFVHVSGAPMCRQQVQHLIDLLYRHAGIRGAVPRGALVHSLRHGYATQAVRSGCDLPELRDFLGHDNIAVTDIYLHADPERLYDLAANHSVIDDIGAA